MDSSAFYNTFVDVNKFDVNSSVAELFLTGTLPFRINLPDIFSQYKQMKYFIAGFLR